MRRLRELRIGYDGSSKDFSHPGDRRRFAGYARRRGLSIEPVRAGADYDLVVTNSIGDLPRWSDARRETRVVFDLCDGYLEDEGLDPRAMLRGLGKALLRQHTGRVSLSHREVLLRLVRRCDAVVCASPEQSTRISPHNANVHALTDFHSEFPLRPKSTYERGSVLHVVWEGMGGNAWSLREAAAAMREVAKTTPIHLHVITDPTFKRFNAPVPRESTAMALARNVQGIPTFLYAWHAHTMPAIAARCDVAVIPIPQRPRIYWLKPENKLLIFWRLGLPVLTTATPAYARTTAAAGIPEAAIDRPEGWRDALARLAEQAAERARLAEAGHAYVLANCTDEVLSARWDAVFRSMELDPS